MNLNGGSDFLMSLIVKATCFFPPFFMPLIQFRVKVFLNFLVFHISSGLKCNLVRERDTNINSSLIKI